MRGAVRYIFFFSLLSSGALVGSSPELSAQWVRLSSFNGSFYNEVFFATSQLGFICTQTGTIHRTVDGGDSWNTVSLPGASVSSNRDVTFPTGTTGFISGEDGIWKTTDGGSSWSEVTPAGASGIASSSTWFRNTTHGIWGYGSCADSVVTFWRTTDGGSTWNAVYDTASSPDVAVGGITYQAGTWFVSGGSGKFWKSTDDGVTWTRSSTASAGWQEDLIENAGLLLIASANGTSCSMTGGGRLLRSSDGGTSWTTNAFPSVVTWGVSMYSATAGIAVGDRGAAYRTLDGGLTWGTHDCGLDPLVRLDDVYMVSATNGFAVGDGVYRYRPDTFSVRRDTLDFGDVLVGSRSTILEATIQSLGTLGTVTQRRIVGTDRTSFGSTINLSTNQSVPSCGEGLTPLYFEPLRSGSHTAEFEVTLQGKNQVLIVTLIGNGVRPRMNVDASIRFDSLLCDREITDSILVRNFGDYPLEIDSIGIANTRGSLEIITPAVPITVLPLSYRPIQLRARASGTGMMSGTLLLFTNDPDYRDVAREVEWNLFRKVSGFEATRDTIMLQAGGPGDTVAACIPLINESGSRVDVTGLRPLLEVPEISARLADGAVADADESIDLCFSASATDTITRCETYILITEPCTNQRTITVCYRADEEVLAFPDTVVVAGPCDSILDASFHLRNDGPQSVTVDSMTIDPILSGVTVASDPLPAEIESGDSLHVRAAWDGTSADTTFTTPLLLWRSGQADTVVILVERIAPVLTILPPVPDTVVICSGEVVELPLAFRNDGRVAATPRFSIARKGGDYPLIQRGGDILPGTRGTIDLSISAIPAGTHSLRLRYETMCRVIDSLDLVVVVRPPALVVSPIRIDLGDMQVGSTTVSGSVTARNVSSAPIVVRGSYQTTLRLTADGSELPRQIDGGDSILLTIMPDASRIGSYIDTIRLESDDPCGEAKEIIVLWSVVEEGARLSGGEVLLEGCDSLFQTRLRLTAPLSRGIEIGSARLSGSSPLSIIGLDRLAGRSIEAKGEIEILVRASMSGLESATDTLEVVLVDGTMLTSPISIRQLRPDVTWDTTSSLLLRTMTDTCQLDTLSLAISNLGDYRGDLLIHVGGDRYEVSDQLPTRIDPDNSERITLVSRPGARSDTTVLVVEETVCGTFDTIKVVHLVPPGLIPEGLSIEYEELCLGSDQIITARIPLQRGTTSLYRLSSVRYVAQDGSETVPPFEVSVDSSSILVELQVASGAAGGNLEVETAGPCPRRFVVPLALVWRDCSLPSITIHLPEVSGSWGEEHRIPISIVAPAGIRIDSLHSRILVDPEFFDLYGVEAGSDWGLDGSDLTIDAATGVTSFSLGTELPLARDTTQIGYLVGTILRGPVAGTLLRFDTTLSAGRMVPRWVNGSIGLHDFCDAEGRLLHSSGAIGIKSVGSNPGRPPISVTYEIPFIADHRILLYDRLGQAMIERSYRSMPAGERIEVLSDVEITSGSYTIVIEAGLQRLIQHIVIVE